MGEYKLCCSIHYICTHSNISYIVTYSIIIDVYIKITTMQLQSLYFLTHHAKCRLLLHVGPTNYIHNTSNDIHTVGSGLVLRIRGGTRFKGRGGYPMETSDHFIIHQNTKHIC